MSALCFRTEYLGRTLDSLAGLAGLDRVAVYVSQDGRDLAVADLVQQYGQGAFAPPRTSFFDHWQRERVPQLGPDQASHIAPDATLTRPHRNPIMPLPDEPLPSQTHGGAPIHSPKKDMCRFRVPVEGKR